MSGTPIDRLVQRLARLPGVGEKTAARLAFHLLGVEKAEALALAEAIVEVKTKVRFCETCWNFSETSPCALCADARRDANTICVVARPQDVAAIERAGGYRGLFHVLHGVISPLDGVGPDDLRIGALVARCGRLLADAARGASRGRLNEPNPSYEPGDSNRAAGVDESGQNPNSPELEVEASPVEVIVATSPSVERRGDGGLYIANILRPLGVRTSRIATGLPMGGELEYADRWTLTRAIDDRRML